MFIPIIRPSVQFQLSRSSKDQRFVFYSLNMSSASALQQQLEEPGTPLNQEAVTL
jgi:hypothetical protein